MRALSVLTLLAAAFAPGASASAQQALALAPFRSVALSSGGEVVIRYGPAQAVSVLAGSAQRASPVVEDGRLRIGRCRPDCPHGERLRVEIVTPALDSLAVDNGGTIVVETGFPRQAELTVAVDNGGRIDARGIEAAHVAAAVAQGGIIFTRPVDSLDASVRHGGIITYWGDPAVRRSVQGGGVVARGEAGDERRPLARLQGDPTFEPPVEPIPPVPPVPAY